MIFRVIIFTVLLGTGSLSFGQTSDQRLITGTYDTSLASFIEAQQANFKIKVFYKEEWVEGKQFSGTFTDKPFVDVLNESLTPYKLKIFQYDADIFVIVPQLGFKPKILIDKSTSYSLNKAITIGNTSATLGNTATLSGFVIDGKTEEPIVGGIVYALNASEGVTTDENGFYKIEIPIGEQQFRFSYVGYTNGVALLDVQSSGTFNIDLYDDITELSEVTITAESPDENIQSVVMGVEKLDINTVKKLPVLLGEADVVKSLMLLPGVTSVGEGASGFNVRGGSVGENLILQDGAEIFNSSHLFGLFSVFNPDLVDGLTLYKGGGIQADMGGRLSSVLEVDLKDGNKEEYHGRGGLGSLMARFSMEGPIVKGKSSFAFGGRTSYSDWLIRQYNDIDLQRSKAGFSDVNLKLTHEFSEKDNLSMSGYLSRDYFQLANDTLFTYGTKLGNIEWSHYFSNRFFSSTRASVGQYYSNVRDENGNNQFEMKSKINYLSLGQDFTHTAFLGHEIKFGAKVNRYEIHQGNLVPLSGSVNTEEINIPKEIGFEWAFYAADTWRISTKLSIDAGLRYSMFNNVGPGEVFQYEVGVPMTEGSVNGVLNFDEGETIKWYGGFEPRASMRYAFNEKNSIKIGYNRLRQYMHLVSNTAAITPVDIWQMSNTYIRPAVSDQYSIGYFRNFNNNNIEASVELYYKDTEDILDYKGGANLLVNNTLEADLLQGQGRAHGVELSLKKKTGKFTGWISYTYSRTELQAISPFPLESVNNGNWYPANFDKPHNLSIVYSHKLTKRITFNANFLYSTGRPITAPTSVYRIGPFRRFPNYSERNQYRIPDYHRLDVSLTIDQGFAKFKKVKSEWNISIYNVYARKNAYSIFFTRSARAYKLAILGFIPSISYNFIF